MTTTPAPHHPPSRPSSIPHVALAAHSFRVYGLDSPAWKTAREERRRAALLLQQQRGDDDGDGDADQEAEDVARICDAVVTALVDDAGGYGTAGFHATRVGDTKLLPDPHGGPPAAVYTANLIPCDPETKEAVDPSSLLSSDEDTGEANYAGNDEFYLNGGDKGGDAAKGTTPRFRVRVTVSKAAEGVAARKYYEAMFAKRKGMEIEGGFDVEKWVDEDEELSALRQGLMDAREEIQRNGGDGAPLGYYVEAMLVGPHVPDHEVVIAPPAGVDRGTPGAGQSNGKATGSMASEQNNGGAFQSDIYASSQFGGAPGPWEKCNLAAFGDIALDVRKALARVEFPIFPEGCKDKTFRETYQLNARLKSGSFATVCRGTHRATGKKIAVKCVLRKDLPPGDDAAIYDEVLILSTLRHGYICPLIDFFEERECYFLVMELMSGGDLFDRIGARNSYTEDDARNLCRKMLESLRYCHENSVAHCDMKPKNLLLVSEDDDVQMKLADFGFAMRVYEPKSLTKQCGTPFFVAPEVLMRSPYDQQSDMWSCGVIMFLLLGGDLPFMGRSQKDLFRKIVMGRYEFEEEAWAHVSEQAKDLVKNLLVTDPSKRLTSREAMASPWMRQRGSMLARNNLQYTSQRLKGFNARLKLRASMIAVGSVVSLRMSIKGLGKSGKSLSSVEESSEKSLSKAPQHPSFLANLPVEDKDDEDEAD